MTLRDDQIQPFRNALLSWYAAHSRNLPWRNSGTPYHIWISEIMLQQTRVDQARPYFERFVTSFPTVQALADSDLDTVLKNWEGLGYYSRARNLHKAAKQLVDEHGGKLPGSYDELLKLPGIGPYTAAAVASIAFGLPYGVLDGNVIRVLSRLICHPDESSSTKSKKVLQALSNKLVAAANPGDFNQAMMELGATCCTPRNPTCTVCPVRTHCCALQTESVDFFPVVKKKPPIPHYNIAVGLVKNDRGQFLIRKRPENEMLGGMWEFPGERQENNESLETTITRHFIENYGISVEIDYPVHSLSHAYSHFKITVYAFACQMPAKDQFMFNNKNDVKWVADANFDDFAFHRAHRKLIDRLLIQPMMPTLFDKI